MSLINDALKEARKAPPQSPLNPPAPLRPVPAPAPSATIWLLPALVIFLIIAATLFIGWSLAHRSARPTIMTPAVESKPVFAAQPVVQVKAPVPPMVNTSAPATRLEAVPVPAVLPLPKLQGIFYSPTAPSAIIDGQTVRTGDPFLKYRVKAISKSAVTLVDRNGQATVLNMGN